MSVAGKAGLVLEVAIDQLQSSRMKDRCRKLKEAKFEPLALEMKELASPLDRGPPRGADRRPPDGQTEQTGGSQSQNPNPRLAEHDPPSVVSG
jgi:hypothetical protein